MNDETINAVLEMSKQMDTLRSTCVYVLGYLEGKPNRTAEENQILVRVRAAIFDDKPKDKK